MANPIKTSDLIIDDGAIQNVSEQLALLEKQMEQLNKKQIQVKIEAEKLNTENKKLSASTSAQREQIEGTAKQAEELNRRYKKYQESIGDTAVKIAALKNAQQDMNRVNKLTAKLNASAEGSYNNLSAQYSLLKLRLNQMTKEQRENTKAGREMEKQSREIYERMKDLQEATGKHTLNVGNYKSALEGLGGPIGNTISGLQDMKGQFTALIKSPLALVLGAVIGVVTALGKAFMSSEKGAGLMAKASGYLQGLWSTLVKVASGLAETIEAAFNDPLGAIKDFGRAILENIVNRFKAVIDLGGALGRALSALWNRDMKALKNAANDAGGAVTQMITGLDVDQQKAFGEAVRETAKEAEASATAFMNLAEAKRANVRINGELTKQAEKLRTQEELAQQAADDTTLSLKAQQAALLEAQRIGEQRARAEIRIAQNQLALLNTEIRLRRANGEDTLSLYEQQVQAVSAVEQAERELTVFLAETGRQRREIARDNFERELDFAIDFYDAQKMILERQANDTSRTLSDRANTLGRLFDLDKSAFASQIQLVEEFTGQRVNLQELALLEDERIVRERLALLDIDDVTSGRILEILRERKAATQDLADIERDLVALRRAGAAGELSVLPTPAEMDRALGGLDEVRGIVRGLGDDEGGLFDNIRLSDGEQQALKSSFDFAKQQLAEFSQARIKAADVAVKAADREVSAAQTKLQTELEAAQAGYASNVDQARQELELAEATQAQALRQQEKAIRQQQQLETIQQTTSLITASAKIWGELGFPAAIPALAVMWGSFAASKIRAAQLTKIYRDGGDELLDWGGSHASGNDIYLGQTKDGKARYAERGERLAIFNKKATQKYGVGLTNLISAINAGTAEAQFGKATSYGRDIPLQVNNSVNVNTATMERELTAIRRQGETQCTVGPNGELIERYKNRTRIIRA